LSRRKEIGVGGEEKDARWQELVALRAEVESPDVVFPTLRSRVDGRPREPSPRTMQLAQALAISDSWSRISDARSRRLAA
jgi:hypothetical protein